MIFNPRFDFKSNHERFFNSLKCTFSLVASFSRLDKKTKQFSKCVRVAFYFGFTSSNLKMYTCRNVFFQKSFYSSNVLFVFHQIEKSFFLDKEIILNFLLGSSIPSSFTQRIFSASSLERANSIHSYRFEFARSKKADWASPFQVNRKTTHS